MLLRTSLTASGVWLGGPGSRSASRPGHHGLPHRPFGATPASRGLGAASLAPVTSKKAAPVLPRANDGGPGGEGTMIGEHSTRGWNVDRDEGNQTTCRVSVKDKHDLMLASPQPAKEAPGTVVTIKSARQGLRVVRGPGWRHGDVDGGEGGEGTITRVDLPGIVEVQWDATGITPSYDLGSSISSDALRHAPQAPLPGPGEHINRANAQLGLRVVRGPDWPGSKVDRGPARVGTLVGYSNGLAVGSAGGAWCDDALRAVVRWDNGHQESFNLALDSTKALLVAPARGPPKPGKRITQANAAPGLRVEPGPDWSCGYQGTQRQGTLVRPYSAGRWVVKWDNQTQETVHSTGAKSKYELQAAPVPAAAKAPTPTASATASAKSTSPPAVALAAGTWDLSTGDAPATPALPWPAAATEPVAQEATVKAAVALPPAAATAPAMSPSSHAKPGELITAANVAPGLRVVRGPDWQWGVQDGFAGSRGTLMKEAARSGWWIVQWDGVGSRNSYRVGYEGKHDLQAAPVLKSAADDPLAEAPAATAAVTATSATEPDAAPSPQPQPEALITAANAAPGVRVVRGPDWKWGEQDGGAGGLGTLLKQAKFDGWWVVRWDNMGHENSYRVGHDGKHDLQVAAAAAAKAGPAEQAAVAAGAGTQRLGSDKAVMDPGHGRNPLPVPGAEMVKDLARTKQPPPSHGKDVQVAEEPASRSHVGGLADWYPVEVLEVTDLPPTPATSTSSTNTLDTSVLTTSPTSSSGASSTSSVTGPSSRGLQEGDMVRLWGGARLHPDRLFQHGSLKPGVVGVVVDLSDIDDALLVQAGDRTWWYDRECLELATEAEARPSSSPVPELHEGDIVRPSAAHKEGLRGPLSAPANPLGVVMAVDQGSGSVLVQVGVKGWWYPAEALELVRQEQQQALDHGEEAAEKEEEHEEEEEQQQGTHGQVEEGEKGADLRRPAVLPKHSAQLAATLLAQFPAPEREQASALLQQAQEAAAAGQRMDCCPTAKAVAAALLWAAGQRLGQPITLSPLGTPVPSSTAAQLQQQAAAIAALLLHVPPGSMSPRDGVAAVWAAAALQLPVQQAWISHMWQAVQPAVQEGALGAGEQALLMWGMAELQQAGSRALLLQAWGVQPLSLQPLTEGPNLTLESLQCGLWALAQAGAEPSFEWTLAAVRAVERLSHAAAPAPASAPGLGKAQDAEPAAARACMGLLCALDPSGQVRWLYGISLP